MRFGREMLFRDEEGGLYASTHDQEGDEAILIEPESLERYDLRRRIGQVKAASGLTQCPANERQGFNPLAVRTYDLVDVVAGRFAGKRGLLGFADPTWPGWLWCCPEGERAVPVMPSEIELVVAVDGVEPWPRAVDELEEELPAAPLLPPDQRVVKMLTEAIAAGRDIKGRELTARANVSGKRASLARAIVGHDDLAAEVIAGRMRLTEAATEARRRDGDTIGETLDAEVNG
jgi:hypothetical protein